MVIVAVLTMNLNTLTRITAHNQTALREGLTIVRNILASNKYPDGFTTAELFKLLAKESPPADFKALKLPPNVRSGNKKIPPPAPPRPNHPIKSMTCVHSLDLFLLSDDQLHMKLSKKVRTTHP